jgi:hypothetical protein
MQTLPLTQVSEQQWERATDEYELGLKSAAELAAHLRVSPATFARQMKLRGARKGSRAASTVVDLKALLERRARRQARMKRMQETAAAERAAAVDAVIGAMMDAIAQADLEGDVTLASDHIYRVGRALRVKKARR